MSELNPDLSGAGQPDHSSKTKQLLPTVKAVDSVGMTVADMDRSLEFYSQPSFKGIRCRGLGANHEHLHGVLDYGCEWFDAAW